MNVDHEIGKAMSLHATFASLQGNVVSGFDAQGGTYLDVCVNHDHVAHIAGSDGLGWRH